MKRQVHVEMQRRYETSYVQLLWEVSAMNATGKIQEISRRENYVCRAAREKVPSTESGDCCWQVWHNGSKHECGIVSWSSPGFPPARLLGIHRNTGQHVWCGFAHWHGGSQGYDRGLGGEGNDGLRRGLMDGLTMKDLAFIKLSEQKAGRRLGRGGVQWYTWGQWIKTKHSKCL